MMCLLLVIKIVFIYGLPPPDVNVLVGPKFNKIVRCPPADMLFICPCIWAGLVTVTGGYIVNGVISI